MTTKAHINYNDVLALAIENNWLTRATLFEGEELRKAIEQISDKECYTIGLDLKQIAREILRLSDTSEELRSVTEKLLGQVKLYTAEWDD